MHLRISVSVHPYTQGSSVKRQYSRPIITIPVENDYAFMDFARELGSNCIIANVDQDGLDHDVALRSRK